MLPGRQGSTPIGRDAVTEKLSSGPDRSERNERGENCSTVRSGCAGSGVNRPVRRFATSAADEVQTFRAGDMRDRRPS